MADYKNINIRNKRATFDYEIIEEWIAGIVLVGTEIKSVRLGKASITDSYCYFDKGELWIRGVNIAEYGWGTCNNHVPRRDRKLLLNRKELNKIQRALQDRGLTVVGLRLFLNERGLAKVVVGLARGRKAYDKREYLKENDAKREMDKAMKNTNRMFFRKSQRMMTASRPPTIARWMIWSMLSSIVSAWLFSTTIERSSGASCSFRRSITSTVRWESWIKLACESASKETETASLPLTLL